MGGTFGNLGKWIKRKSVFRQYGSQTPSILLLFHHLSSLQTQLKLCHLWLLSVVFIHSSNVLLFCRSRSRSPYRGRSRSPAPRGSPRYNDDRRGSRSPRWEIQQSDRKIASMPSIIVMHVLLKQFWFSPIYYYLFAVSNCLIYGIRTTLYANFMFLVVILYFNKQILRDSSELNARDRHGTAGAIR